MWWSYFHCVQFSCCFVYSSVDEDYIILMDIERFRTDTQWSVIVQKTSYSWKIKYLKVYMCFLLNRIQMLKSSNSPKQCQIHQIKKTMQNSSNSKQYQIEQYITFIKFNKTKSKECQIIINVEFIKFKMLHHKFAKQFQVHQSNVKFN